VHQILWVTFDDPWTRHQPFASFDSTGDRSITTVCPLRSMTSG
jgi:hypothetical protein